MFPKLFLTVLVLWASLTTPFVWAQGKVKIVVSVDWEGEDLRAENLAAMQRFREEFPQVPLQHFLNAAYYTKTGAQAKLITKAIRSVLRPGDEHGLHVHAWRSLVTAAGVPFRVGPSFVAEDVDLSDCKPDCGVDVALTAYRQDELRSLLRTSVRILEAQGFDTPRSFRAGGWQADANVLQALAAEGFTLDSSATYAPYLEESWGNYNLVSFVARLWPESNPRSQPYEVSRAPGLWEVPNNGCLSDYVTGEQMKQAFLTQVELLKKDPTRDVYLSIGFHQETAQDWLPRLNSGLKLIAKAAKAQKLDYEFVVGPWPLHVPNATR